MEGSGLKALVRSCLLVQGFMVHGFTAQIFDGILRAGGFAIITSVKEAGKAKINELSLEVALQGHG